MVLDSKHGGCLEKTLRCLNNGAMELGELEALRDDMDYYMVSWGCVSGDELVCFINCALCDYSQHSPVMHATMSKHQTVALPIVNYLRHLLPNLPQTSYTEALTSFHQQAYKPLGHSWATAWQQSS